MASEPSQFLNEMPLDLMEDLSRGPSWLSFARSASAAESRHVVRALRGETGAPAAEKKYPGKTYDSVDSIAEFFRQRGDKFNDASRPPSTPEPRRRAASATGGGSSTAASSLPRRGFVPAHTSATRSTARLSCGARRGRLHQAHRQLPRFGQKKLIEKYAGLEKAE